jgi:hypothetical protein
MAPEPDRWSQRARPASAPRRDPGRREIATQSAAGAAQLRLHLFRSMITPERASGLGEVVAADLVSP